MTSEYEFKEFPDYVPDDGITAAELVSGNSMKTYHHLRKCNFFTE